MIPNKMLKKKVKKCIREILVAFHIHLSHFVDKIAINILLDKEKGKTNMY